MAITEDEDINDGGGSGDAKQEYYLRVGSALQDRLRDVIAGSGDGASDALTEILEIAAQEFGIEREGQGESKKSRKKPREKSVGSEIVERRYCRHSCSDHKELMNPKFWGTLPRGLLERVFSHLPIDAISRLQLLSKEWQSTILSQEFARVCSVTYPKMVCLITKEMHNLFWVRVLDHLEQWHTYKIKIHVVAPFTDSDWTECLAMWAPTMTAECEDAGLICFVTSWNVLSKKKKAHPSFFFNVVNPLTRKSYELPTLLDQRNVQLVQIHVDRETKAFKVCVLSTRLKWTNSKTGWTGAGVATHVYDSLTAKWTTIASDVVPDRKKLTYNFATGRLLYMDGDDDLRAMGRSRTGSTFFKQRLYVLKLGSDGPANDQTSLSPMYYIEEFQWETIWVKVKSHRCDPFEHPTKTVAYSIKLHACSGFLMVIAHLRSDDPFHANQRFGNQHAWLYDLSTRKWSILNLPLLPVGRRTYDPGNHSMFTLESPAGGRKVKMNDDLTYDVVLMCEPQWASI